MQNFSSLHRKNILQKLQNQEFDVLIIGGGITGTGIALDAASRGMKVALIEKNDFASGTSSKSTKLIHGGLRYLKQFDFWLVKEVGTERAIVHKLAPHLVIPEKMILPIIENGTYGTWLTSFGLKIYDVLASVEGDDKRKMLNKEEALGKEPLLPEKILEGAGYYAEYRTDDARLTIEVLKTSLNFGVNALNYIEAKSFIYKNKTVCGVNAFDTISKTAIDIKSKYVVNAAGPWVDELRQLNKSKTKKWLHLTKGVHLVVPHEKFPVKQSVYFDIPDGRMMFAIPRGKTTYFGTTDTHYLLDKNKVEVDLVDAVYLICAVNNMFPSIYLTLEDILSSWAGLRPLIHEEGRSASELSRKDEIFVSKSGLISIAGGKLSGYRKMAERVIDLVCKKHERKYGHQFNEVQTENIVLNGGDFNNFNEVKKYRTHILNKIKPYGLTSYHASYLVHNYGKQSDVILNQIADQTEKDPEINLVLAELWFAVHFEMATKPLDFFIRRTGRLVFDVGCIHKIKEPVLSAFANYFNWNDETLTFHRNEIDTTISEMTNFK